MADQAITQLRKVLRPDAILSHRDELLVYECDGLPQHKVKPGAVVFPGSTEEVAAIVGILSSAGIPFTARGAGTGVSGGALALDNGVIIELARMRRILEIDSERRVARVETGLVNANLSRAAAAFNLYYAPDPSSQPACTIGGNIAENAGGSHCLKYGVTVDHVRSMRVVLSDGEIYDLHGGVLTPGYDLVGLFVGSEGTFGVATEATLNLLPTPTAVRTILAEFPDVNRACQAVSAIIAAGLLPAALELIDAATIRAVEASVFAAGLPADAGAALIIELDGLEAGLDFEAVRVEEICRDHGARGIRRAVDEAERQKIWLARKGAFGAMGRISPDIMIQDAVVPRSKLPDVLAAIYQIVAKYGLEVANVFHAGDGNLHPLLPFDSNDEDQVARIKIAGQEIMEICVRAGGTITGEHGVGLDKIDYLPLIFSDDDMEIMLRVRAAFDPLNICNPGKIIPIRRGCGEARSMASQKMNGKRRGRQSNGLDASVLPQPQLPENSPLQNKPLASRSTFDIDLAQVAVGKIVGAENVQVGLLASPVAAFPGSVEELAEVVRLAHVDGWTVTPAGARTWLDAGNAVKDPNITISTARLDRLIEYEKADLVATVEAGMTLSTFNSRLAAQWLPLDPPGDGRATLGGIAATGSLGAQSFGYGSPRHHIIGMRVAMADGRVVKAGGRVVKNVAGYDLCKLFAGSYGTLGIIVELTWKLRPRPAVERTVVVRSPDPFHLIEAGNLILGSELLPVAVEVLSPGNNLTEMTATGDKCALFIRFSGAEETVSYQTIRAMELIGSERDMTTAVLPDDIGVWSDIAGLAIRHANLLVWRAAVPRNRVKELLAATKERYVNSSNLIAWQAGVGDGRLRVAEDIASDGILDSLGALRSTAASLGGCLVVESAPAFFKENFDSWGEAGNSARIMRRLKGQLDPQGQFSPGRFVAGI